VETTKILIQNLKGIKL